MPEDNEQIELNADESPVAEALEAGEVVEESDLNTAAGEPVEPTATEPAQLSDGQKFLDAFGDQGGVWFAQGKTFEDATQLHIEALSAKNKELEEQIAERGSDRGGDAIDLSSTSNSQPGKSFAEFIKTKK